MYTENHKDSIRKLLELISKFSKVAEYKIHMQKSLAFVYTKNELSLILLGNWTDYFIVPFFPRAYLLDQ